MDSITFKKNGEVKNTYTDWGLVPTGQIDPPSLYEKSRSGSVKFMMRFGDVPMNQRLDDMVRMFLSDGEMVAIFSNDPKYEYRGKWDAKMTNTIGTGIKVELKYELEEFKFEKEDVNSKWLWDEFNFNEDHVTTGLLEDLKADNDKRYVAIDVSDEDLKRCIGDAPVVPEFFNKSDAPMSFKLNGNVGKVGPAEKKSFKNLVLDPSEETAIFVKGSGLYDISFIRGVR